MKKDTSNTKEPANQNGRLYIYSRIKEGIIPTGIIKENKLSERSIWRYMKELILAGCIKKIGYGVWKAIKQPAKVYVDNPKSMSKVRSHGFGFYLKIPTFYHWNQRKDFLIKNNIAFKNDNLGHGQVLDFKGYHIFLYKNGIRFLQKQGFEGIFTNSATLGNEIATRHILSVIRSLENLFKQDLATNKQYKIKITKQHHALIKNELANLYNKQGKKLQIFNEDGLWLMIDNSFNLDELETVKGTTASLDMDNVVKPFFNSLKEAPFTAYDFRAVYEIQQMFNENIVKHMKVLDEMSITLKKIQESLSSKS
jgi:hypothetical protein